jgi:8-oxo-dGTP pyrophosphatase MutT (NUDIX family)
VHPDDGRPTPWIGPDAREWAHRWSCDAALAAALVVAGVRETFEETGILLAGRDEHSIVGAVDEVAWTDARAALEAGTMSLGQLLREHELYLRADLLHAWAHWITPEFEPRRFDTRFFVAVLPVGQTYVDHGREADDSFWIDAGAAVQATDEGRLGMMAPTRHNLRALSVVDLAGSADPSQAVSAAAARPITVVQPRLVEADGSYWLTSELDPMIP